MTTHITNNSKEVLSNIEAALLDISPIQRERLNFIGFLNYSSFSGAGIVKELVRLKEYWISLILVGNPLFGSHTNVHDFTSWQRVFQVKNYLSDKKKIQILIVSKQSIKLKNILVNKKWNQTKTEILERNEFWKYLGQGHLPHPGLKIKDLKIINIEWDKI
jgi:hypothetical protein